MSKLLTHLNDIAWREASIAATPELAEKRLQLISRNPNLLKRIGSRGLHITARYASASVIELLSRPYTKRGLSFVGSGWNSTVIQQGSNAIKIIRATELMNPEERAAKAEDLRRLIGYNSVCHLDTTLPGIVNEIPHPVSGNPVVAIIQPHIVGFDALSNSISPDIRNQLQVFAERSLDEMAPNGVAPDLVGAGNILVCNSEDAEKIHLVDTVALEDLDIPHATYPHSIRKLRELAHL